MSPRREGRCPAGMRPFGRPGCEPPIELWVEAMFEAWILWNPSAQFVGERSDQSASAKASKAESCGCPRIKDGDRH
jgi:hypothetical protein